MEKTPDLIVPYKWEEPWELEAKIDRKIIDDYERNEKQQTNLQCLTKCVLQKNLQHIKNYKININQK